MSKALKHLRQDERFAEIIEATKLRRRTHDPDVYRSLLRAIVFQQLSGKAAATIHGRFLELFEDEYPHAKQLVKFNAKTLRAAGLSGQKSTYLKNVAQFWLDQNLAQVEWKSWTDDEIIDELTSIKGVGTWTVQMLLMSTLKRPDVFPMGDLGIRNAIIKKYRLRSKGKALDRRLLQIAKHWRPYRTKACLYLWSWLDNQ